METQEVLSLDTRERCHAPKTRLINLYGGTEEERYLQRYTQDPKRPVSLDVLREGKMNPARREARLVALVF